MDRLCCRKMMKKRADGFVSYERPRKYYDSLFVNLANFFACLPLPYYNGLTWFLSITICLILIIIKLKKESFEFMGIHNWRHKNGFLKRSFITIVPSKRSFGGERKDWRYFLIINCTTWGHFFYWVTTEVLVAK